ncbi:MAG: RNA polymerase sporulation sigma factor SigK [Clostridiales bacterium]|nr:RNA polymerase sporulation sigma factor SigK [Clostridiales bacterium]
MQMILLGLWMNALYLMLRVQGSGGAFPRPLRAEEERYYLERMAAGDGAARDALIEHNLRLVAHIVKKYYADPSDQDDLISIGTIGLIKAVSSYRPDKGVRLATYAARCIENEILMHFRAGRKTQGEVSLDETQDADGDGSSLALLDMISVEDDRLHQVEMSDRYQKMYQCLDACLDHRERAILSLRYGLSGGEPMTQREIAAAQGISRSYVSRIEKKALAKLAAAMGE